MTDAVSLPTLRRWRSTNSWSGRPYGPPIALVLHTESGGESGTVAELLASSSALSAHYRIRLDGSLDTWIDPADRAWSNGILEPGNVWNAIAEDCGVDPALNPNHVTVTCETEDLGSSCDAITDRQFDAVLRAGREAQRRFPHSLRYLVRHSDISPQSRPNCPGERWTDNGRFEALAAALGLKTVAT